MRLILIPMSWLMRLFPFLFDDVPASPVSQELVPIETLPREARLELARDTNTSLPVLTRLAQDEDTDIRVLLAQRLGQLAQKITPKDAATSDMLLKAIRGLAEESVTPVRIALASALKDVANCPADVARKLADDAERAVAEPVIRYSLSLSDDDLLDLIARHPQDWHTVTIAQRNRLPASVSHAVIETGNTEAGIALLENDRATIAPATMQKIKDQPAYKNSFAQRQNFGRTIKREMVIVAQNKLHDFLAQHTDLDRNTTTRIMDTVKRRVILQDNDALPEPGQMNEGQLKDALSIGRDELVLKALAARAGTSTETINRMAVESGAAKPVIALCVKAGLSMNFAVLLQQRMTRLPPAKILYPKEGSNTPPLTDEEIRWQWDFFGL